PQLHVDQSIYYLTNPGNATILYCNENDFWTIYDTDEIGFRNPEARPDERVDFLLLGDSFAEGACVKDEDTFAGNFRKQGHSVLNLAMGGSGPLLQLAILREYGTITKPDYVIWFVFYGNDLRNLREEKTTQLYNYLVDENYTQNLYQRRDEVSAKLKEFLEIEIESNLARRDKGKELAFHHCYGETLDIIEAEKKEKYLIERSAAEILKTTRQIGAELVIVALDHYAYSRKLKDFTRHVIVDFAERTNITYLEIGRDRLVSDRERLYSPEGPHFSPEGYGIIADEVLTKMENLKGN
ncbi:MAG: SGNH/GDSL hydrolase family protein, partial [bacterium]